jgi:DNA repair protein RadB
MDEKISTGAVELDKLLERDIITTIYGPAASGKSNLCMLCAVTAARQNKKVIFIDTESSFSIDRLKQIAPDYEKILENIIILRPGSFEEQQKVIRELRKLATANLGLIIVDTIVMLYRVERGKSDSYELSRELGLQISFLSEMARKLHVPVILTSQVYSPFNGTEDIKMVGGDILNYASKCVIELQNFRGIHRLILKKHRSIPNRTMDFKIIDKGITKA